MERKKIINTLLSFSAVTNIHSWMVKSALSNVVSLIYLCAWQFNKHGRFFDRSWSKCVFTWQIHECSTPYQTFRNFRALYSSDVINFVKPRYANLYMFFGLEGSWAQPQGPNFPSPWATMLALRLDCSKAAITTPQKVLPIWKLVELKMLDFSDRTRTGISILTSAADSMYVVCLVS